MRKQSAETKLRHSRREVQQLKMALRWVVSELLESRRVGQMMSNICYNAAQLDSIDAGMKASMTSCQKSWDAIPKVKCLGDLALELEVQR